MSEKYLNYGGIKDAEGNIIYYDDIDYLDLEIKNGKKEESENVNFLEIKKLILLDLFFKLTLNNYLSIKTN